MLAACGQDERAAPAREDGQTATATSREEERSARSAEASEPPKPPPCPAATANCAQASGTIVAIESRDPDGDGDAHFVLLSEEGITAPGVSVIDVARELRPRPLPEVGTGVSASGPVFSGSYGQRQIEALALRVASSR